MRKNDNCSKLEENQLNYPVIKLLLLFTLFIISDWNPVFGQNSYWQMSGQNLQNTRHARNERTISVGNVGNLEVNWAFTTAGDVSATPAVDANYVYFPDWGGFLYKVNAKTGALVWSHPISYYTGVAQDFARATPAISGNMLVIGTQASRSRPATLNGEHVLGINKITGELVWMTEVDDHIGAMITQSAVIHGDRVFVGVASNEEGLAISNDYPCCSFRGSMLSLDLNTGQILWQTYMTPEGMDFSGSAVWGSTPVIDPKRNSVYVTTGNNYTVPQAILDCVAAGGTPDQVRECVLAVPGSDENYFNAIVAMDLTTGGVKWVNTVMPFDAWTAACLFGGDNCPEDFGPDYDFGQGPALYTAGSGGNKRELLGAGQKSGIYWAVDPDNGNVVWSTEVGPGGEIGGLQWGSAVDGNRVYVAVSNSRYQPHVMTTGPNAGDTIRGGFWAALNAATGALIWENAADNPPPSVPPAIPDAIARNISPVSVANGVSYAAAGDAQGTYYAFNAATGHILWSFESGGTSMSGAAIADGKVYWGSGYSNLGFGTPNNKLYSFGLGSNNFAGITHDMPETLEYLSSYNFPNPFSGSTDIVFELPGEDNVKITIHDMVGNEIEVLVDERMPGGFHKVTWDALTIPPGTYLYKLKYGDHSEVRQIVLLN